MCDPAFCLSALRIMCTASHTYSVPFEPGVHSVCETGPASLRPLSCPALGPRVIDRPQDSGSGGFAPSSPAQPRLRAAPLRSSPWALSARWLSGTPEGKNLLLEISFIPRGEGFFGFFCRLRRCTEHPILPRPPGSVGVLMVVERLVPLNFEDSGLGG